MKAPVEKIPLTKKHLEKIRANYPATEGVSDELLIDCIVAYDKHHTEHGVTVLFAICFPTFNDYLISYLKQPSK